MDHDTFKNPPPWHLIDLFWDFEGEHKFESVAIDVVVLDPVPNDSLLYISPINIDLSGQPMYCGFQTATGGYVSTEKNSAWKDLGRAGIFSRWDCKGKPKNYVRFEPDGATEIGDYEGDFVSCRRPFPWTTGLFTCELRVVAIEKDCCWVAFSINGTCIGKLRFDGSSSLKIDRNSCCSFVEIYGDAIPISSIPKARIRFENLRVNGEKVKIVRRLAIFPEDAPSVASATRQEDGGVLTEIGPDYVPHDENEEDL
jgi:hypothetical protein